MNLGSIFVGLAVAVITIAYIVRPFRVASGAAVSRTDKLIEAWVRAAPVATPGVQDAVTAPGVVAVADTGAVASVAAPTPVVAPPSPAPAVVQVVAPSGAVNFCPQCGRRVTSDYRFCPGCGALLPNAEGAPSDGEA
jgi:hypothetical protein